MASTSEPNVVAASGLGHAAGQGEEETLNDESLPRRSGMRLESGTRLDRYHILEMVGQGGMGVVYAAYDADLDRKVALKVLHDWGEPTDERAQQRLLREAQAMARLSHPNVITVHEVKVAAGRVFVSMEFVEGGTLTRWLKEHRAERTRVLEMFRDVGRGLAAAHAAGLVHRDVKPDNVLIGPGDRPRVTDFGLARPLEEGSREPVLDDEGRSLSGEKRLLDATLTRADALVGTPAYMSPEQLQRRPTTAASDQFSFCVALYEALWGVRPFVGNTLVELATNILSGTIVEPERDRVPRWVRAVVLRGLSLRPEDRWPSMAALIERLEPSAARHRRKWFVVAGVAGIGLLGAGPLISAQLAAPADPCQGGDQTMDALWTSGARAEVRDKLAAGGTAHSEETATLAVAGIDAYAARWAASHRDACEAHERGGLSDEALDLRGGCLDDRLRELRALVAVLEQASPEVRDHASEAVDELQPVTPCEDLPALRARVAPPTDPAVRARVQAVEDEQAHVLAMLRAGDYAAGLARSDGVLEAARGLQYAPLVAKVLRDRAALHERLSQFEDAAQELREGWSLALAAGDDMLAADCLVDLVDVLGYSLRRYADAELRIDDASAMIERVRRQDAWHADSLEGNLDFARGHVALRQHRYEDAATLFERALRVAEQQAGTDGLRAAEPLNALASTRLAQLDTERALELNQRVLEIRTRSLGASHPLTAMSHNNLGLTLKLASRFDEAIAEFERAGELAHASLGPDHPTVRMVGTNLAEVYSAVGRYAEAAELYTRSYRELRAEHIEDPWLMRRVVRYASSLTRTGRTSEARAVLDMALSRAPQLEPPFPEVGIRTELARLELEEGHADAALEQLDIVEATSDIHERPSTAAWNAVLRARALALRGERERAAKLWPIIHAADDELEGPRPEDIQVLVDALREE